MIVHPQAFVKVNAQVDNGVVPLVEAFNAFPEVMTVSSCEGDDFRDAYVAFANGESWRDLGEFVEKLSESLGKNDATNDLSFTLSIDWYAGGGTPTGYLRVPRQHIQALAEAIRSAASGVAETTSACHTSRRTLKIFIESVVDADGKPLDKK